ncbi:hypothetical protein [Sporosarcina sp. G11-34]|uniref:hypothetical protein n=1 Tax=Sporosarcina sp. G11-34 TaxID=2849605 RepID=UPI0022A958BD|nr:hypothetical protein [Sporosarcina sp. G11-34]MCZ2259412.1 hypothetical protein [Sporosarcina sp. G11-34]
MTNKKVGPPKKTYSESILKQIIYEYKSYEKPNGNISYSSVWNYAKNIWYEAQKDKDFASNELNDLKKYTSEDLWRKNNRKTGEPNPGKGLIDDTNKIKGYFITDSKNKKQQIPNVEDTVYKLHSKEDIIESLKPLEKLCLDFIEKESVLSAEMVKLKADLEYYKNKSEKQEEAIFQLARYGRSNEGLLKNVLNTGTSKSKLVADALENIFINPMEFLYEENKNEAISENVINIAERKKNLTDTYGL